MAHRILVVEDDLANADYLTRGLKEEGFTVEHAADGETGSKLLAKGNWDVVILDWWLPGQDGLSLLKKFRASGESTPVLFLTARDAISDRVQGLDGGANDYLCKPFSFEELLARIRALIRRPQASVETTLRFADITFDLVNRVVKRGGQKLDFTTKEEALLLFFMRHPNEILSRSTIYEHVWEEKFDGVSNTLEVHVMELRRKLEMFGPRLIRTLRGRGYQLTEPTGKEEE
ncbi:response regulator transcription factor [Telmatocola sphagniphila]|uniref:Response regulator transcription factor n=1 Tax=Telmatocola sphagniphila TaxID=1123043 RepID=A0A8E6B277_9BACT|nr:response regulator transcription factor [Telmatocola sphagniphila]QVL30044.1 response regulator transcription factor [Telmatocola sphagniphila]